MDIFWQCFFHRWKKIIIIWALVLFVEQCWSENYLTRSENNNFFNPPTSHMQISLVYKAFHIITTNGAKKSCMRSLLIYPEDFKSGYGIFRLWALFSYTWKNTSELTYFIQINKDMTISLYAYFLQVNYFIWKTAN